MNDFEQKITNILRHEAQEIQAMPQPNLKSWDDYIAFLKEHRRVAFQAQNVQISDNFPLALMPIN